MVKQKSRPRSFDAGYPAHEHGFLYRLVSSQRFLAVVGLTLLVLVSLPLAKTYSQKRIIEKEVAEMQDSIRRFEQETAELQEMIKYLDSEQSLESQARMNLNLKKPEETVVVIERGEDAPAAARLAAESAPEKSNLKKWREYFFGI